MAEQRGQKGQERQRPTSFIVRLWLEPAPEEGGPGRWRGHIQSVQSGEGAYFRDLREMARFLEEQSGVPFPLGTEEGAPAGTQNPEQPQGG